MGLTRKKDSFFDVIKWIGFFIFLFLCVMGINTLHQQQLQNLKTSSLLLKQKSFLVSQMHEEMLSMSRIQLQIFQASDYQQVKDNLQQLSKLVSNHLVHYHQLNNIADESDTDLLMQFRISFEKWHSFNENLLTYGNVVSDSGFIHILNKVDLAFSQIDLNPDDAIQIIAEFRRDTDFIQEIPN